MNRMKIYIYKPHIIYDFNNLETLKLHGEEDCNCCHTWDYYHPNGSNREMAFVYGHIPTITAFRKGAQKGLKEKQEIVRPIRNKREGEARPRLGHCPVLSPSLAKIACLLTSFARTFQKTLPLSCATQLTRDVL